MARIDNLSHLPTELLVKIFRYLSLVQRKNVRLTNRRFYEICCSNLANDQKFVFLPLDSVEEIAKTLTSSLCRNLNLDFRRVTLDRFPATMWADVGPKIVSLYFFFGCSLNQNTFQNILIHCPNLRHWTIEMDSLDLTEWYITRCIHHLTNQNVIHENLISLDIWGVMTCLLWKELMTNLIAIFPRMKTFKYSGSMTNPSVTAATETRFHDIQLAESLKPINIENLLNFGSSISFRASRINNENFEIVEFRFTKGDKENDYENLLQLLTDRKQLKVLEVKIFALEPSLSVEHEWSQPKEKNILFHMSRKGSNLQECHWKVSYDREQLYFNDEEFSAILDSRLEILNLSFRLSFRGISRNMPLHINDHLHTLIMIPEDYNVMLPDEEFAVILEHLPKLRHLECAKITNKGLLTVFERQSHIQCLKVELYKCRNCNTGATKTDEKCLTNHKKVLTKRIENLQCFCIHFDESYSTVPKELFENSLTEYEYVFPGLKHFRVTGRVSENPWELVKTISNNSPGLELLQTNFPDWQHEELSICVKLKNLVYFTYDCNDAKFECNSQTLFMKTKKLRFLMNGRSLVSFNRFTNKIFPLYVLERSWDTSCNWKFLNLDGDRCPFEKTYWY